MRGWIPLLAGACLGCGSKQPTDQPEPIDADVDSAETAVDAAPDVAPTPAEQATFDAVLDSMTKKLADHKVPGGAIAVVLRGKLAFSAGVGFKRDDGADPVTDGSLFRVASLTKPLVATGIMQLVEAGLVDLSHPVTEYVPYFKRGSGFDPSTVLVKHLLSHTGGIPDDDNTKCSASPGYEKTWVTNHGRDPLWSPPGRLFDYSNGGYTIAGVLLEEISTNFLADQLRDGVLAKAGMTTATFDAAEAMAGDHVTGHYRRADGTVQRYEIDSFSCASMGPWAGAIASVKDYAHLAETFLARGGDVLKPSSVQEMEAVQTQTGWTPGFSYGYGTYSYTYRGLTVVGHDGRLEGFQTSWLLVPSRRFAVAVFLNGDPSSPEDLALDAIDAFLAPKDPILSYKTDPSTWSAYVGSYVNPYTALGDFNVSLSGGKLTVEIVGTSGTPATARLYQSAGDTFFFTYPGASYETTATFVLDAMDKGEYFVTRAGVGHRAATAVAVAPKPPVDTLVLPRARSFAEIVSIEGSPWPTP